MARVQKATLEKARRVIKDLTESPAFPSNSKLLESNRDLYNVITQISGVKIPDKTICGLLVETLDIGNDVTGEALWKRYRRVAIKRDESRANMDTESDSLSIENSVNNINGDGIDENEDASNTLFIPLGISQADLAAGLAEFFESKGYSSASLLKTCLMAMDEMAVGMEVAEIKDAIDTRYQQHDAGEDDKEAETDTP